VKNTRNTAVAIAIAAVAAVAAIVATTALAANQKRSANFTMAVISDTGGLQDRSFNQLANDGRLAVGKQLGIKTRVYETHSDADRIPNAVAACRGGYNMIFEVGFLNYTALNSIAPRCTKSQFAGIDEPYSSFKNKPKNAAGIVFTEEQGGYLVGYLAALELKKEGGKQIISAVGANNVPAIVHYISGYIQGAKKANPRITVLANYANDPTFNDQSKCHETALGQIQKGSRVVFQVAGGCGLGALQAAKESKIWGIGVDADQRYLGPFMMTSALKRVDTAVEDLTKLAYAGNLATGRDYIYSLKNNGVGLGSVSPKVPKAFVAKTKAVAALIASGKIKVKNQIKF
jgi:basic membrane protein A